MLSINGGERASEKRKRVTRLASLSPLNPATALWSLLSVALSSVTAKSNYMIPFVFISCQCTTTPTRVFSFERRQCSIFSDGGVQFTPTTLFNLKRRRCSTTPLYSNKSYRMLEKSLGKAKLNSLIGDAKKTKGLNTYNKR